MPIVAVRPRVLAALGALVLPGSAQVIRLRIQKRVQRLLDRRPYHLRPGAPGCAPHRSGPPAPAAASSTPAGSTPASMVGSIVHASEVSLPLLVPTSKHKTRIKCARNSLRYPRLGLASDGSGKVHACAGSQPGAFSQGSVADRQAVSRWWTGAGVV